MKQVENNMKETIILILTVVFIIPLCSCQSKNISEQNIPLLCISDSGECFSYNWDTCSNSITKTDNVLFENHEDPHTLMYTLWNGYNKYVIYDGRTKVLDDSTNVLYREYRREFYYAI